MTEAAYIIWMASNYAIKVLLFVFRIISALITIFVVVPFFLIQLLVQCAFGIINGMTYYNFIHFDIPPLIYSKIQGIDAVFIPFIKVMCIISSCIVSVPFDFISGVKSIKF
mgnify:CR=1 FL=1